MNAELGLPFLKLLTASALTVGKAVSMPSLPANLTLQAGMKLKFIQSTLHTLMDQLKNRYGKVLIISAVSMLNTELIANALLASRSALQCAEQSNVRAVAAAAIGDTS